MPGEDGTKKRSGLAPPPLPTRSNTNGNQPVPCLATWNRRAFTKNQPVAARAMSGNFSVAVVSVTYNRGMDEEADMTGLVNRVLKGDRDALAELFGVFRPRLWRMINFR